MDLSRESPFREPETKDRVRTAKNLHVLDTHYTVTEEWMETHHLDELDHYLKQCLEDHIRVYCEGDASKVVYSGVNWDAHVPYLRVLSLPVMKKWKRGN